MSPDQINAAESATQPIGPLGLIVMNGCEEIGHKVNDYLVQWETEPERDQRVLLSYPGVNRSDFIIPHSCPRFGTGEGKAVIDSSIRGHDLYILCDVTNYSKTFRMYNIEVPMSPDNYYQDLKRIIAAACDKARRITVIMPYLYEGRQHKRSSRESLDCAVALQELTAMGVSHIITFDAHDPRVQNAIPINSFESFVPTYQLLKALANVVKDLKIDKDHMMIVSPDEGAAGRNIYYASVMGLNLGLFYKRRDYTTVVNGRNPIVAHDYLGEDVAGKDIYIADDVIATGESMLDLCRELRRRDAGRIFMAATFAQFTAGPEAFDQAYADGLFDYVISTNLNYMNPEILTRPWFIQADLSKYMAYIIATLNHDMTLSGLIDPIDRINGLLTNYTGRYFGTD